MLYMTVHVLAPCATHQYIYNILTILDMILSMGMTKRADVGRAEVRAAWLLKFARGSTSSICFVDY